MREVIKTHIPPAPPPRKLWQKRDYSKNEDLANFCYRCGDAGMYRILMRKNINEAQDLTRVLELIDAIIKQTVITVATNESDGRDRVDMDISSNADVKDILNEIDNDDITEDALERAGFYFDSTGALSTVIGSIYDGIKSGDFNLRANAGENLAKGVIDTLGSVAKQIIGKELGFVGGALVGAIVGEALNEAYEVATGQDNYFGFGGERTGKYEGGVKYGDKRNLGGFLSDTLKELTSLGEADTPSYNPEIGRQTNIKGEFIGMGRRPDSIEDIINNSDNYDSSNNSIFERDKVDETIYRIIDDMYNPTVERDYMSDLQKDYFGLNDDDDWGDDDDDDWGDDDDDDWGDDDDDDWGDDDDDTKYDDDEEL